MFCVFLFLFNYQYFYRIKSYHICQKVPAHQMLWPYLIPPFFIFYNNGGFCVKCQFFHKMPVFLFARQSKRHPVFRPGVLQNDFVFRYSHKESHREDDQFSTDCSIYYIIFRTNNVNKTNKLLFS